MSLSGIYKVVVTQFENQYAMELHILQEGHQIYAALRDGVLTRSFFYGSVNGSWKEEDANCFLFRNAQIDEYVGITSPLTGETENLTPPGGWHVGGVQLAGTVFKDTVTAAIILSNGLVHTIYGQRIEGEPVVTKVMRNDGIAGINRFCTCGTSSCTHHGFCDSCNIFESIHCTAALPGSAEAPVEGMEGMANPFAGSKFLPAAKCMNKAQEKIFGPMPQPPEGKRMGANGKPMVEHGPHHLTEE